MNNRQTINHAYEANLYIFIWNLCFRREIKPQ